MSELMRKCPNCGAMIKEGSVFCTSCGSKIEQWVEEEDAPTVVLGTIPNIESEKTQTLGNVCPNCGATIKQGSFFCTSCGHNMETPNQQIPPIPPAFPGPNTSGNYGLPPQNGNQGNKPKFNPLIIVIAALCVVLMVLGYFAFFHKSSSSDTGRLITGKESVTHSCSASEEWDEGRKECVEIDPPACSAGEEWDESSKGCVEKDPADACFAAGDVWDYSSDTCMTEDEYYEMQERKACEANGKNWNSSNRTCESPGIDGYTPGTYVLNYDMKVRSSASTSSSEITVYSKGKKVEVTEVVRGTTNSKSIWGKISGGWMCIKDTEYNYLSKS